MTAGDGLQSPGETESVCIHPAGLLLETHAPVHRSGHCRMFCDSKTKLEITQVSTNERRGQILEFWK